MTINRTPDYYRSLVKELLAYPKETSWLEFKHNNADPQEIGEYISALANSAVLEGKSHSYLIWGIDNDTHDVLGTTFSARSATKGNEELENWLLRLLSPRPHFRFIEFVYQDKNVVLLEIPRASDRPVQFEGREYIRIGSYKKSLKDFPDQERTLWRLFDNTPFEYQLAVEHVSSDEVLALLDYSHAFEMLGIPLPESRASIMSRLEEEQLIRRNTSGKYDIFNLAAILFAKELKMFRHLGRKKVRVIIYEGDSRIQTIREVEQHNGYAIGFEEVLKSIDLLLPRNEVIGKAFRREVPMFPPLAVRELLANALIHQDFLITGAGPMVEIFANRMEITNPGTPLVSTDRFLDASPRSRNDALASLMRRMSICEERGTGIDKVVFQTEFYQLPAPLFGTKLESTFAVLFAPMPSSQMDKAEKIRACYLHACLRYVTQKPMTNSTLRERLGIAEKNKSIVSRIIRDALEAGFLKLKDPTEESKKLKSYLPFWA